MPIKKISVGKEVICDFFREFMAGGDAVPACCWD